MKEERKEKRNKRLILAGIIIASILLLAGITFSIVSNILKSKADEYNNKNDEIIEEVK